jgi:hypothetical protein
MGIYRKIGGLMKKLFILIGLLLTFTLNAQLNVGVVSAQKRKASTIKTLDGSQTTSEYDRTLGTGGYYLGQSFTPTFTGTLNCIDILGTNSSDATFEVRISTSINFSSYLERIVTTVNTGGSQSWITSTSASNPVLTSGTKYYFAAYCTSGTITARMHSAGSYAGGTYWCVDFGADKWNSAAWEEYTGRDWAFRLYLNK